MHSLPSQNTRFILYSPNIRRSLHVSAAGRGGSRASDTPFDRRRDSAEGRLSSRPPRDDTDQPRTHRGGGRGRNGVGRGRSGRGGDGGEGRGAGRTSTARGRGRGGGAPRWQGGRLRGDEALAYDSINNDESGDTDDDVDDDDDGAIDEGFVIIGRADSKSAGSSGGVAVQAKQASARPNARAAAASGSGSSPWSPRDSSAPDPLDGSRFWIEVSGIDDLEEDEDDEGEGYEEEDGEDEDGEDMPQTVEALLDNMHSLGFTLTGAAAGSPDVSDPAPAPEATGAEAPVPVPAPAASAVTPGSPGPRAQPQGASTINADLALRDLRDTFIASMKPPSLPPWFLGPVELSAVGGRRGSGGKGPARSTAAKAAAAVAEAAPVATGRGVSMRTKRDVAPGELLAVSLPLAIRYCRRGTTPENEDLAEMMMGMAGTAGGGEGVGDAAVANDFAGLTDLQQSLLGLLWRGTPPSPASPPPPQTATPPHVHAQPQSPLAVPATENSAGEKEEEEASAASGSKRPRGTGSGGGGGGGGGSLGPVKRSLLELVAKSAAEGSAPRSAPLVSGPELYQLVNVNCLGEDFQDLALCRLRGERPLGHIALWPEAAFTAHSCAPNATAYAMGERLVVRAAAEEKAGSEVSLNWLGSLLTAPLEQRRAELRLQYGFTCGCVRCTAEDRYTGTPLASLLASTYATCQELSPQLEAAIEKGDVDGVAGVQARLLALQEGVEAGMRAASPKVNVKVRRWLQASVYDMYDMLSLCADELAAAAALGLVPGGPAGSGSGAARRPVGPKPVVETESLVQCCRIMEGISPGSDGHVGLAAELVMRCLERYGTEHEEYRQVRALLVRAFRARYGNVGPEVMELLVAARLAAEGEGEDEDGEEAEEGAGEEGEE